MIEGWEDELTGRPSAAHLTPIASSAYARSGSAPGTIQLDGDTATGRAYIQELVRTRDGLQGLNFAIYHAAGGRGARLTDPRL